MATNATNELGYSLPYNFQVWILNEFYFKSYGNTIIKEKFIVNFENMFTSYKRRI